MTTSVNGGLVAQAALRKACKEKGLSTQGTIADLTTRLKAAGDASSESSNPPTSIPKAWYDQERQAIESTGVTQDWTEETIRQEIAERYERRDETVTDDFHFPSQMDGATCLKLNLDYQGRSADGLYHYKKVAPVLATDEALGKAALGKAALGKAALGKAALGKAKTENGKLDAALPKTLLKAAPGKAGPIKLGQLSSGIGKKTKADSASNGLTYRAAIQAARAMDSSSSSSPPSSSSSHPPHNSLAEVVERCKARFDKTAVLRALKRDYDVSPDASDDELYNMLAYDLVFRGD